jgi:hypothetical protein
MSWKEYQKQTAEFFRSLGCVAEVEAKVDGARAQHRIDVWVRFKKFGLEIRWVIECKYWNKTVTKEKILALKAVVDDIGADRGILISEFGFQSGAIRASEKTNLILRDLDELKQSAQEDLLSSVIHGLETKAINLKYALHDLYVSEHTGPHSLISKPRIGVNGLAVMKATGCLAMLQFGFEKVRLGKLPYPVKFDETGQQILVVDDLNEFVVQVSKIIKDAELTLNSQLAAMESAGPVAAPDRPRDTPHSDS